MDLTESKYLNYALPDMKDGIACIPVSGGADSTYLAILLHQMFPEVEFLMLFTDTGTLENPVEDPEIYVTLDKLEAYLGKKIERLVPERGLFELLSKYNNFLPNAFNRWCTRELKLIPFQKWVSKFKGVRKYMFVGLNADEADRVAFSLDETETITPLLDMGIGRQGVLEGLSRTIGIPKNYRRRVRSGCFLCPMQSRQELVGLLQEKPVLFLKAEECEKLAEKDLDRWPEAPALWKDSGISANWQTLPMPDEGDIEGKTAKRAPDLFGSRLYVAAEFFFDNFAGDDFIWHQRVVTVAPMLHHLKQQIDDRYQHLLTSAEVYGMTREDVKQKARFAIYVFELPSAVFDPESARELNFTWVQGWAYKQLRHVVSWATRTLHAEGMRQQAALKVRSELSVQAELRDASNEGLGKTQYELGTVVASQWYQPQEVVRVMSEDEELSVLPCPVCSF